MKNIVIVGGSSGITAALAKILLERDEFNLTLLSRTSPNDLLSSNKVTWIECDVASEKFPDIELKELHGLVYGPGTINLKPFHRTSLDDFRHEMELNVWAYVKTVQYFLKPLKASKEASVVSFSSVASAIGMPFHSGISAAKGALSSLTKTLAAEYAQANIRFNAIAPSLTETPLAEKLLSDEKKKEAGALRHPLKRIGTPNDLAEMAAFLLSDKAGWITGQIIGVDGGMSTLKV